jgi:hypothetical protein
VIPDRRRTGPGHELGDLHGPHTFTAIRWASARKPVIMLMTIAAVIVPYLIRTAEKRHE